jgi:hypothetical protein
MADFDIAGAKKAGYSDAEIADHLAQQSKFDVAGARKAGYSDAEILQHVAPTKMAWGDVPLEAIKSVPSGVGRLIGGIYQMARHPIDTANNLLDLGAGALHNVVPKPIADVLDKIDSNNPAAQKRLQESVGKADAMWQQYTQDYGSLEGFKRKLATDPVGVVADLSTVLGVGAALTPGKVSATLAKASNMTNPLSIVGAAGSGISKATAPAKSAIAERLMQSALKPSIVDLKNGNAAVAVRTLLDNGINATKGGVEKLKVSIDDINNDISGKIAASNATVSRAKILSALEDVRNQFTNQVSPSGDLKAIQGVADDFTAHPAFSGFAPAQKQAENALAKIISEKETALQTAGKLQTFAAQQKSLAHGKDIPLLLNQPEFQPYYNPGATGRTAQSPSSLPVPGYPRIAGRYTNNIDRVTEGLSGAEDAMSIFNAKRLQEVEAAKTLENLQAKGATIPVQIAQQIKQGTYGILNKKYGQIGSAETEAQKGLARGLKESIADAVPGVGALNAKESALIKTLGVTERRALMDLNKNPMGLSLLANNPASWAMFMADKSALFKSLAARMVNPSESGSGKLAQMLKNVGNTSGVTPEQAKLAALLASQAGNH